MLRVGLTGGIACGKSRVLARIASSGLPILDLDAVSHALMAPGGAAYAEVVASFGPGIRSADGRIDRSALGALVFADPVARARLNALVHPRVRAEEARIVAGLRDDPLVVTEAALLIEAGVHLRFERLVVVHCSPELQLRRLMERDGIPEAAARLRIEAQMPVVEKRRFAHFSVDTSGTPAETDAATDRLVADLRAIAAVRPIRVKVPIERALGLLVHGPARGPRGVDAPALLREIVECAGDLELERVRRLLVPPADGLWYRAARADEGRPGPEALAAPLSLWALSRTGADPDFLAAAAFSLARLTHTQPSAHTAACLHALAVQELAASGQIPENLGRFEGLARRWGGAEVSGSRRRDLTALLRRSAVSVHAAQAEAQLLDLLERLQSGGRRG
jgi:dephospho-CoA kinase